MKTRTNKKGQIIIDIYDNISKSELLPGDILLMYYGSWITEFHGRHRRKEFGRVTLPPYHAAMVYAVDREGQGVQDVMILDQEIRCTLSLLREYTSKSSTRIDVVRYEATDEERERIVSSARVLVSEERYYDWRGFFGFARQMPFLNFLRVFKPSSKDYFCSDAVTYVIEGSTNIVVSDMGHNRTAPIDMLIYGLNNHKLFTLKRRS